MSEMNFDELKAGGRLTPIQYNRFVDYCVDLVWLEVCSEISEGMGLSGIVNDDGMMFPARWAELKVSNG